MQPRAGEWFFQEYLIHCSENSAVLDYLVEHWIDAGYILEHRLFASGHWEVLSCLHQPPCCIKKTNKGNLTGQWLGETITEFLLQVVQHTATQFNELQSKVNCIIAVAVRPGPVEVWYTPCSAGWVTNRIRPHGASPVLVLFRLIQGINTITVSGKKPNWRACESNWSLISALIILLTSPHIDYVETGSYGIRKSADIGSTSDWAEWPVTGGVS